MRSCDIRPTSLAALTLSILATHAFADAPVIENIVLKNGQAHVTVSHPDSGWDHYADVWRIYGPDGQLLAERILVHPHETEQPFTRSTEFRPPDGVTEISVIAACTDGDQSEPFRLSVAE